MAPKAALGSAWVLTLVVSGAAPASPPADVHAEPASGSHAERTHAQAMKSLHQGDSSRAYGLLVDLANAGHPASARQALWMCLQGPELFGKDWDCGPDEAARWADLAGVPAPRIVARSYPTLPLAPAPAPAAQRALAGRHVGAAGPVAPGPAGSHRLVAAQRPPTADAMASRDAGPTVPSRSAGRSPR